MSESGLSLGRYSEAGKQSLIERAKSVQLPGPFNENISQKTWFLSKLLVEDFE